MTWDRISLGDIALRKGGSVDPKKHPNEVFELYSIPAFDAGAPEVVAGSAIGSSKKAVEPNDVMISRIVPHIRRACVVGPARGHRKIASSEWIIFRDERFWPQYLRWTLLGDAFHSAFMRTVSGVGGSLLRARPSYVYKISIPFPPLPEQRRIAAMLYKADAIRRKRQQTLDLADQFLRSAFLDMFGDAVTNPKGWPVVRLAEVCLRITDGTHQPPDWSEEGLPFLFVSNIVDGHISFQTKKHISEETWYELTRRCPIESNDILYTTVGSYGNAALVDTDRRFAFQRHIAHIKPDGKRIHPEYLVGMLQSPVVRRQADHAVRGIAQKTLNLGDLKKFRVLLPPRDEQERFVRLRRSALQQRELAESAVASADNLLDSLTQLSFREELSASAGGKP
jgi:type I restriction enzyme, S subunit